MEFEPTNEAPTIRSMNNRKLNRLQQIRTQLLRPESPDEILTSRESPWKVLRRYAYRSLLLGSPIPFTVLAAIQPSAIHLGLVAATASVCLLAVIRFFNQPPNARPPQYRSNE